MIISMKMGIIGSGQSGPRMLIPLFLVGKEIGPVDSSWLHWEWTRRYFREVGGWRLEEGHEDWSMGGMGGIVGFGSFWKKCIA
jgi:hypothetical protein